MDQSRKLLLMAETGADIPPELAEKYNIQIVPMHITFGAETKDDGSFPSEEICAFYDRTGILPKTSGSVPMKNGLRRRSYIWPTRRPPPVPTRAPSSPPRGGGT